MRILNNLKGNTIVEQHPRNASGQMNNMRESASKSNPNREDQDQHDYRLQKDD